MASSATGISKHSLMIAGHRTSVSLEEAFWTALRREAGLRRLSVAALVAEIDAGRGTANLSSAIRVHLLEVCAGVKLDDKQLDDKQLQEGQHVS